MKYEIRVNECFQSLMKGKEACGNCKYFRSHYLFVDDPMFGEPHISEAHFGHCLEGRRCKNRNIYDSCEKFKRKEK